MSSLLLQGLCLSLALKNSPYFFELQKLALGNRTCYAPITESDHTDINSEHFHQDDAETQQRCAPHADLFQEVDRPPARPRLPREHDHGRRPSGARVHAHNSTRTAWMRCMGNKKLSEKRVECFASHISNQTSVQ